MYPYVSLIRRELLVFSNSGQVKIYGVILSHGFLYFGHVSGEPTAGKTRPETILRQLTTKKGQVFSV